MYKLSWTLEYQTFLFFFTHAAHLIQAELRANKLSAIKPKMFLTCQVSLESDSWCQLK